MAAARAAELYQKLYVTEDEQDERPMTLITEAIQQTRQAALREAGNVARELGVQARQQDLSGGYTSELISNELDRLASEGG